MANLIKIKRGTKTQIDSAAGTSGLNQAELYHVTDEGRIALGTGSTTYVDMARKDEIQPLDADLTAIAALAGTSGFLKKTAADTWALDTSTYLTGNQSISISGDASGSGTTAITLTLANSGVSADTYTKVTVDAKGRVTSGTTLIAGDIPTLASSKISDFDTQVRTSRLDQMAAPTASVAMNSQKITGLLDPTSDQDAATKIYVDNAIQGLDTKASVLAATTANITLSGEQTIDGISCTTGDRVLVKNQSTAHQNGIYVVASGAWSRADDAATWNSYIGAFVFVEEGSTNADTGWVFTVDVGGTLGVNDITSTQFSGGGSITAGAGLTKTGNTIDVIGTTNRIDVAADSIDISTSYVGQVSITTLGTITTGTWTATEIGVAYGGLGLTSALTGLVKGNGSAYSAAVAGTDYLSPSSTIDGGSF